MPALFLSTHPPVTGVEVGVNIVWLLAAVWWLSDLIFGGDDHIGLYDPWPRERSTYASNARIRRKIAIQDGEPVPERAKPTYRDYADAAEGPGIMWVDGEPVPYDEKLWKKIQSHDPERLFIENSAT